MWSGSSLNKINAKAVRSAKKKVTTLEDEARPKMQDILNTYGLQITLKTLVTALENLNKERGKTLLGLMVLEGVRGLYAGYMRRYEVENDE